MQQDVPVRLACRESQQCHQHCGIGVEGKRIVVVAMVAVYTWWWSSPAMVGCGGNCGDGGGEGVGDGCYDKRINQRRGGGNTQLINVRSLWGLSLTTVSNVANQPPI